MGKSMRPSVRVSVHKEDHKIPVVKDTKASKEPVIVSKKSDSVFRQKINRPKPYTSIDFSIDDSFDEEGIQEKKKKFDMSRVDEILDQMRSEWQD
jgi:hypothetical protein